MPSSKVLLLNREVEPELINYLYSTKLTNLDKERDPSFGNTKGSKYDLFENDHPIIRKLSEDLEKILIKTFRLDISIFGSFCSIFGAGGGTHRHNHVHELDNDPAFGLAKQKYSLCTICRLETRVC